MNRRIQKKWDKRGGKRGFRFRMIGLKMVSCTEIGKTTRLTDKIGTIQAYINYVNRKSNLFLLQRARENVSRQCTAAELDSEENLE